MNCETCDSEHDGTFGSGRFCCQACARSFSTSLNRDEITRKIADAIRGKPSKLLGRKRGPAPKIIGEKAAARAAARLESGPWEKVPRRKRKFRLLAEQGGLCAICSMPQEWMGKHLPFEMDHVSGDRSDNSRANVRMVCPNCHRQTPTWGSKNASQEGLQRMRAGKCQPR